jgi:hypothetical protein
MAIPELLVADVFKTGAQVQVYELVGGTTLNAIGTPIGADASENTPAIGEKNVVNRVVEYRGELYMAYLETPIDLVVQKFNRGTGLWTAVTLPALGGTANSITGLYVANTGTVQRLFLALREVGDGRILYTDDGTNWSVTGTLVGIGAGYLDRNPGIMFNNKLYQPYQFNGYFVYEIDPIALAITALTLPDAAGTADASPADFAIHDDRLFLLIVDEDWGLEANWVLQEFTGSGFVVNTQITTGANWNNTTPEGLNGQCCLFKDPNNNNLIALVNGTGSTGGDGDSGASAFRLVPSGGSFTPTNITTDLTPTAYRPGARGVSPNHAQDRWFCVVVNDTSPAAPEVYIFLAVGPAPGTGYTVYKYVTDATELGTGLSTSVAGPTTAFAIPHFKSGGGLRINKGTGNQCMIEKGAGILGAYQISYRVYGTVASQVVRLYYSTDQEAPSVQATLSAQTGGVGITANAVTGVTGDDGTTLFTLDWNLTADGVANGDACHLMLDITAT